MCGADQKSRLCGMRATGDVQDCGSDFRAEVVGGKRPR
jgi:hypothetical protein